MANKRKPDNIHLLQGTFQKSRHGDPKKKINLPTKFPICPRWMDKLAKKEWARIKKVMEKSAVITFGDATVLTQYCMLVAELEIEHFEFTAAKHTQLRMVAVELGLTPAARGKIVAPGNNDDDDF